MQTLKSGETELRFTLFGESLTAYFKTREQAFSFQENLRKAFAMHIVPIKDAVETYLRTQSQKKFSKDFDHAILKSLTEFLEAKFAISPSTPISMISRHMVLQYQASLLASGLKEASVNRHFSTIKNFFNECERSEILSKNPAKMVRQLPVMSKQSVVWTEQTFLEVYNQLSEEDQDLLYFLKLTGARLSSAMRLRACDIDLANKQIFLSTKKGANAHLRIYTFPVTDTVRALSEKILENKNPNDFLFLSLRNRQRESDNFSKRVKKALLKTAQAPNTKSKRLSLHGLRHSFASEMYQKGMSANEVKHLLGHSTLRVTETYLHVAESELLKKLNQIA